MISWGAKTSSRPLACGFSINRSEQPGRHRGYMRTASFGDWAWYVYLTRSRVRQVAVLHITWAQ
jgi:hypothetical protein